MTAVGTWDELLQGEELAYVGTEPARPARTEPVPEDLDASVRAALPSTPSTGTGRSMGGRAARRARRSSPPGRRAGKTLAFNLPVADALAREPKLRALYLYPTKALAQDQARALAALAREEPARRRSRRRHAGPSGAGRSGSGRTSILTNPDMLHVGVLPHHDRWGDVLLRTCATWSWTRRTCIAACSARMSANVLRRLRRVAGFTAPSRSSCWRRRRSRTRASSRESLLGVEGDGDRRRRRAAGGADDRALEPAAARGGARPARERARRGVAAARRARLGAACARSASRRAARRPS